MRILFAMLYLPEDSIDASNGMYTDLAKECVRHGHDVTLIGSSLKATRLSYEAGMKVLRVKARRIVGEPNLIKKGIAMATLPVMFRRAYCRYLKDEMFDWIVMPTPPITLIDFVSYVKRKTSASLYLILRDIHPQSSWSLGEIRYRWMYDYLDARSRKAYSLSDIIACMSQRNIDYILEEYPSLDRGRISVLYNWLEEARTDTDNNVDIRRKYALDGKVIALFGGNIALGQRIENIADLAREFKDDKDVVFVVIGNGVKKQALIDLAESKGLSNIIFLDYMPQNDYLNFIRNVDIGLISINENNAAPTCPSKLGSYMSMKIPVLAMINPANDYGSMIDEAHAGFWAVGSDKATVYKNFRRLKESAELRREMGESGYSFFKANMTTAIAAESMLLQMENISR